MSKQKVMILGKLPPPYMGPSIATELLLKSDLKNRFELIHLDTKINHTIKSFGKWNLEKVVKNISIYVKMFSLMRKHKPAVVLIPISQTTTGFIKDSLFIVIASWFKTKIVIQLRGSDFKNWLSNSSDNVNRYVKLVLTKTSGVVVLGQNLKYLFADYFKPEQIFVIPNGGNYQFPEITKHTEEIKILYFANLLASKGIEDVFKAVEILNKQTNQSFSVDVVGEWYDKVLEERCIALQQQQNLPIRIHSPKSGNAKFHFLADAAIFLFPPREPEGHPWSIVEAMAAGLPVISTDQGAIIESVIDQKNGFIVAPKSPEKISEKLKLLLENSELRVQMGTQSRQLYLDNFTEEKMVEKYTALFNTFI